MKAHRVRRIGWLMLASGAVLLLSTYIVLLVVCREPRLQGRPTTSWVRDLSRAGDGRHEAAVRLFRAEGANAVPGLVSVLDRRRSAFAAWLKRLPFHDSMPGRIKDWVGERTAMQDLDRAWAVRMCSLIGSRGRGAQKSLQRALVDGSPFVRGAAARALADTQADPAIAIPLIAAALSDPDAGVRSQAAIAFGVYRQSALPMLAKLESLTKDPDHRVEFSARLAVAMIETPDRVTSITNDNGEVSYRLQR